MKLPYVASRKFLTVLTGLIASQERYTTTDAVTAFDVRRQPHQLPQHYAAVSDTTTTTSSSTTISEDVRSQFVVPLSHSSIDSTIAALSVSSPDDFTENLDQIGVTDYHHHHHTTIDKHGNENLHPDHHLLEESYYGPPIGATYESKLRFPVLGTQIFSLHIRSRTQAHLMVNGKMKLNEPVQYEFDNSNGKLTFVVSEQLKSKMKRYLTSLQEVGYDSATDTPYVKVLPPLPAAIKIFLKRVQL